MSVSTYKTADILDVISKQIHTNFGLFTGKMFKKKSELDRKLFLNSSLNEKLKETVVLTDIFKFIFYWM